MSRREVVGSGPNQLWWDVGFLALGALLLLGGWLLTGNTTVRRTDTDAAARAR